MRFFFVLLLAASFAPAQNPNDPFLPVAVWYGGGKARAPMLESDARAKKDMWRKDVQQIKALGFNSFRAWIDWASGEPRPGEYHFETLEVLGELAKENGLRMIVQIYMDSAPAWPGSQYPDSLFVSSNGMKIEPETAPGFCRDHKGIAAAEARFLTALAQAMSEQPAFYSWDLWSEPHVINWANPTYISRPEFCWCQWTQARFRAWLRAKYKTLDALNVAWYREYASWEDVQPPRLSTILSYRDYLDWKEFIGDKLAEDLKARANAVKSVLPNAPATSHAAGVGLFASPHHWEGQSDDWQMARQVDYYGTSFYPKHSAFVDRDPAWRAALLDFTRSFGFAQGRNGFYIGELQAGFGTINTNLSTPVTANDLVQWAWSALARGARAICYYAYYPMSTGYEAGGFGMVELDGSVTERARAAGEVAKQVEAHRSELLASKPYPAQAAVLYNPLMHFVGGRQRAASYGGPQGEVAGIERDSLLGIYRALFTESVPLDYVHAAELSTQTLAPYRLLYVPYPVILPDTVSALPPWVQAGGTLVLEARAGWTDQRGRASEVIPGLGLAAIAGARETSAESVAQGKSLITWDSALFRGSTPGRWMQEVLTATDANTEVLARFADGKPAATRHRSGKGQVIVIGSFLSAAYETQPTDDGKKLFFALLEAAGVGRPVQVTGSPVEVRLLKSGSKTLAFIFNWANQPAAAAVRVNGRQLTVNLPPRGFQFEVMP